METGLPWGVVFESVDMVRRHPAQLYEAVYYFVLFGVVAWCYRRFGYGRVMPLFYCGVVMVAVGVFRMGIECVKEVQVAAEVGMWWNLGQWLSVPFVVAGVVMVAVTGVFAARRGE